MDVPLPCRTLSLAGVIAGTLIGAPAPSVATQALPVPSGAGDLHLDRSPRPFVDAVIGALADSIQVVGIGEIHYSATEHAHLRSLLLDPRLPDVCDVIVVEFGNHLHQDLLDRHVLGYAAVPADELATVWRNTTQSPFVLWNAPVYRAFFDAVREVNQALPAGRRVRVVAGDPPIDWSTIHSAAEHYATLDRSRHFARMVEETVLAPGLRGLLIAGSTHVRVRNPDPTPPEGGAPPAGELLAARLGTRYLAILPWNQEGFPDAESVAADWPVPALVPLAGGPFGDIDTGDVLSGTRTDVAEPYNPNAGTPLGALWHALLWMGPAADHRFADDDPVPDPVERAELDRRAGLYGLSLDDLDVP